MDDLLRDRCRWWVEKLDNDDYDADEDRLLVSAIKDTICVPNLVSSHIYDPNNRQATHLHLPVLDLDRPYTQTDALQIDYLFADFADGRASSDVVVVPSTTEGHCHLYLQFKVPERRYLATLMYLAVFGVIEPGYATASIRRGGTFVRLPGVKKEKT